jgi:hypothetical protein
VPKKGYKWTPEHHTRHSAALQGNKNRVGSTHTKETKEKIAASVRLGKLPPEGWASVTEAFYDWKRVAPEGWPESLDEFDELPQSEQAPLVAQMFTRLWVSEGRVWVRIDGEDYVVGSTHTEDENAEGHMRNRYQRFGDLATGEKIRLTHSLMGLSDEAYVRVTGEERDPSGVEWKWEMLVSLACSKMGNDWLLTAWDGDFSEDRPPKGPMPPSVYEVLDMEPREQLEIVHKTINNVDLVLKAYKGVPIHTVEVEFRDGTWWPSREVVEGLPKPPTL